ncbi:MAG: SRPBCC family protein [Longimicrobiales bacterium]
MQLSTDGKLLRLGPAAGMGAALMYFLDPARGARRRSQVQDRVVHAGHRVGDGLGRTRRDLRNQAQGVAAASRRAFSRDQADDHVIAERVRAQLGRLVSHPGAIDVSVEQGSVTLYGPVLASEAGRLLARVDAVRGVGEVHDRLERHESARGVPGLQGVARRPEHRFELLQQNWRPGARLLAGLTGGSLALYGMADGRRKSAQGVGLGLVGLGLLARASLNKPMRQLVGIGAGRRAVIIQKTVRIDAPIEEVFSRFTDWERWPQWMSHVREVTPSGEPGTVGERTHWVVDGLAGTTVRWDAEVTRFVPNELVSWKSVDGSAIGHAGTIQFERLGDRSTRVQIRMSYNPVAGVVGHAVAALLERDPKHQMDDDVARLKTAIEAGKPPRDAARPARRQDSERNVQAPSY